MDRFYELGEATLKMLSSKAITVDGLDAWELRYEVRIDYMDDIPGDNVNLVVVQHTDGSRSVLLTFATIGDTQTQRQVDNCRDNVRVEKRVVTVRVGSTHLHVDDPLRLRGPGLPRPSLLQPHGKPAGAIAVSTSRSGAPAPASLGFASSAETPRCHCTVTASVSPASVSDHR